MTSLLNSNLTASSPAVSNSFQATPDQLAGLREVFTKSQDEPIEIFQHGDFEIHITPNVHGNLIVEACHVTDKYWNWIHIGICDTLDNAKIAGITWIDQSPFTLYRGSWLRVWRLQEGYWVGNAIFPNGTNYSTRLDDNDADFHYQKIRRMADKVADSKAQASSNGAA